MLKSIYTPTTLQKFIFILSFILCNHMNYRSTPYPHLPSLFLYLHKLKYLRTVHFHVQDSDRVFFVSASPSRTTKLFSNMRTHQIFSTGASYSSTHYGLLELHMEEKKKRLIGQTRNKV